MQTHVRVGRVRVVMATIRPAFLAALVASLAACVTWYTFHGAPAGLHADFSQAWFGARALLHHQDPYPLVGPGTDLPFRWRFPNLYPATTFVAVLPLGLLPEVTANILFVWVSTFLLAYGALVKRGYFLPIILSFAFFRNAQWAQWSILTASMLFLPAVAGVALAKPQAAFPVIASSGERRVWVTAIAGSAVLFMISLVLLPGWPSEWFSIIRHNSGHLHAPITRPLGFLIPLVLLRWRQRRARFAFLLACMPQTWEYYNALPLLALAATNKEAWRLSLISTLGGFVWLCALALTPSGTDVAWYTGGAVVLFAYLPVVATILLSPDEDGKRTDQVEALFT